MPSDGWLGVLPPDELHPNYLLAVRTDIDAQLAIVLQFMRFVMNIFSSSMIILLDAITSTVREFYLARVETPTRDLATTRLLADDGNADLQSNGCLTTL